MKQTQDFNSANPLFTPEQLQGILAVLNLQRESDPLRQLEYEEKLETKQLKNQKENEQKEASRQNAVAMEQKRKERELDQYHCSHIKPNRLTNVAGQRDHSQNTHYFCQKCQKEWLGALSVDNPAGLPYHLIPESDLVGGPQIS